MNYGIGIDLGTTFSSVAVVDQTGRPGILKNRQDESITPSVIYFGEGGIVTGEEAKEMQALGEENVASFFKRSMGDPNFAIYMGGRDYSAEDLSEILLRELKSDAEAALGVSIGHAVITVPAYFNNFQREATIRAGEAAGLDILRIINEPTAAALAYGAKWGGTDQTILVYDLGGGTFDITIVRITRESIDVLATDGDHELGGKDWDDRIAAFLGERFHEEHGIDPLEDSIAFNDLLVRCEDAKKQLTARGKVRVSISHGGEKQAFELTRDKFEEITRDLMERTERLTEQILGDAGIGWGDLEGVLLVGGSTRMPMVYDYVERMSGKKPMQGVNVDEAVALGASIQAGVDMAEAGHGEMKFTLGGPKKTRDVMSHSLGMIAENEDRSWYVNSIIIPKNNRIPSVESRPFQLRTLARGGNVLEVYMLQGESDRPANCIVLGKYVFSDISHVKGAIAVLDISYAYDRNGVVMVEATERSTGKVLPVAVEPPPDDMTWAELPPEEEEVVHLHMSVVQAIDVSGSMHGPPLEEAKQAAMAFVKKSDLAHMSVGLVEFGSNARKCIDPIQNARSIEKAIKQLAISGSTNMMDGIVEAHAMLGSAEDPRFIILLTDGYPDDPGGAIRAADAAKADGIDIITIGTGGADEEYLRKLASCDENNVFAQQGNVVAAFSRIAQVLTETAGGVELSENGTNASKKGFLRIFK